MDVRALGCNLSCVESAVVVDIEHVRVNALLKSELEATLNIRFE